MIHRRTIPTNTSFFWEAVWGELPHPVPSAQSSEVFIELVPNNPITTGYCVRLRGSSSTISVGGHWVRFDIFLPAGIYELYDKAHRNGITGNTYQFVQILNSSDFVIHSRMSSENIDLNWKWSPMILSSNYSPEPFTISSSDTYRIRAICSTSRILSGTYSRAHVFQGIRLKRLL